MFDIGFLELVLIAVISLLVLGPERLPGAARSAGLWFGKLRRMTSQFTSEIDKQLKAEEFREKLRREGDTLGVEHIQGTVRQALDRAKDFEDSIVRDPVAGAKAVKPELRPSEQATPPAAQTPGQATRPADQPEPVTPTTPQPDQVGGERTKQP
ncbi:MAG: twin-arginine translocase subunit TatB [unclassified Hahellaceae]|nr:twin-arginine translocase subunit TatB [Hahellaceae bacterium]|tara:strand:- start:23367 stop:23828 length:462 start_codon:yes stop_codon:yes gene_type:complete